MEILIAGHGELPEALLSSARMIGGELSQVSAMGLFPGETPQDFRARMLERLSERPVELILTDLAGGTPDNVANLVVKSGAHESVRWIIAGASLPLLLEIALMPEGVEFDSEVALEETVAQIRYVKASVE
ncbi:MAG: PTS sugar transporter subunit IIA [Microbacteriaceae bacterium]|nr:PTS sugar transporter subunit IIA [Cryobacterium sp.]MBX3104690.1 PTS sugar transporter subunit IIA [Cryobacterium sp.]MCC6376594.1 PTS sugar transporter subunit IIA [Microbacteriaceae bacterium]